MPSQIDNWKISKTVIWTVARCVQQEIHHQSGTVVSVSSLNTTSFIILIDTHGISFNIPSTDSWSSWLLTPPRYFDCKMSDWISLFLSVLCTICVNQSPSPLTAGHYHSSTMWITNFSSDTGASSAEHWVRAKIS